LVECSEFRRPPLRRLRVAALLSSLVALATHCGKIGYDAPALGAVADAAPLSDASADRAGAGDASNDSMGNVFGDGHDGAGAVAAFAVGSFVKSASNGTQIVGHTLGQVPKALLLWTAGKTAGALAGDYTYAFGVSDGPGSSRSVANASRNGATPSNATRRMAPRAISIVQWGEMTLAEADLASWDAATFSLTWATNDADPVSIHYIAIGGAGVSARIVSWQAPTSPGNRAVGGVGFRPDTVLHFYSGAVFVNAPPWNQQNASLGLGMFDGAGNECAFQIASIDASNPTITAHGMRTDSSIYMFSERPGPSVTKQASLVSIDADGFTLDFQTAETSPTQIFSLALAGVGAKVGSFDKPTSAAPFAQSVTGVGFKPGLAFLTSVGDTSQAGAVSQPNGRLVTGASDGVAQASASFVDVDNVAPSGASGTDDATRVYDELTGAFAMPAAQASLTSLDADGFSLGWTATDRAATRICYWALGSR
jgi:hypothetical protein